MIYRGNIIEVKQDSLVVMLDDCTFQRVKKYKGLEEGMEIYFEDVDIIKKTNLNLKNIALIAASIFLFIATAFYGIDIWSTNYRAVALVSVDINPSIEIEINRNHNVINAIALNEDAKKLPLKNLKNQPIDSALQELVNMARVEGYIKEAEENYILVTSVDLTEDTDEEKVLTDLIEGGKEKIENSASEAGEQVEVIAIQSNKETLKEAKKDNISVGKREILQNSSVNEIKDMSNKKEKDKLDEYFNEMKEEKDKLEKYLKEIKKEKDKSYKYNGIKEEKDRLDKHLKDMEEEANELMEKLKELQQNKQNNGNDNRNNNGNNKGNPSDSKNNNKNNNENINKYNQIINNGQDRLKEIINLQQNKQNIKLKEEKDIPKGQMQKDSKKSKDKSNQEPNKTPDNNGKGQNKNK